MIECFYWHFYLSAFLTGLIWIVQLVHYPSFAWIESSRAQEFAKFHGNRISWIVAPVMTAELITGGVLVYLAWPAFSIFWFNFIGILLIWLCTFALSVPVHTRLQQNFSPNLVRQLVRTNWPRTILWTLRSLLLLYFVMYHLS